jgi:hypothetical protein
VTWGAIISEPLAVQAADGLLGLHVNMPGTVPPDVLRHLRNFDRAPADAISCYWVTNTATSSSRSYWEGAQAGGGPFDAFDIRSRSRCSRPIYRVKNLGKEEHRQPHLLERGAAGSGRRPASTGICVP